MYRFMLKRMSILVLIAFLVLNLVSCPLHDDEVCPPEYENKVDFISHGDGTHHIEYSGDKFFNSSEDIIYVKESREDDAFLGWNGWWYINFYYSSETDNPVFIYETRLNCVYLHEDYDYKNDIFVLEGTDSEIVFSDIIEEFTSAMAPLTVIHTDVVLYSEAYPRLQVPLTVFFKDGDWYAWGESLRIFKISDTFYEILIDNNIIAEK